jgi:hypothetical protein
MPSEPDMLCLMLGLPSTNLPFCYFKRFNMLISLHTDKLKIKSDTWPFESLV